MSSATLRWWVVGAATALVVYVSYGVIVSVPAQSSNRSAIQSDAAAGQLRDIGVAVAKAVLNHDIDTILMYDRPDLRDGDRSALQDKKSDLYCFLFDNSCNIEGRPSVRDILSKADHLAIEVQLLKAPNAAPHGLLLFFDPTAVDKEASVRVLPMRVESSPPIGLMVVQA